MQEIDFNEIKTWLERGQIIQLASQEGISQRTAYRRLSGKTKNLAFVEKAMKLALENKTRIMAGIDKMKTLRA